MERMVTKQDVVMVSEALKNLLALSQQNQQLLKQSECQRVELTKRVTTLENRLVRFEHEMKTLNTTVLRAAEQQRLQQAVMPMQVSSTEDDAATKQPAQFTYYRSI